jgi:hypothetical protein
MKRFLDWIVCQFKRHDWAPGHWVKLGGVSVWIPLTCRRCGLEVKL